MSSTGPAGPAPVDAPRPARGLPVETLFLLLLGAMLLCVAAGLKAVAPEGDAEDEHGREHGAAEQLDATAAVRAASATSTTR